MVALAVAYQFSPGQQLTARIRYEDADAVEPRFHLRGFQINASLALPLRLIDRRYTARLEFESRDRDYENITRPLASAAARIAR